MATSPPADSFKLFADGTIAINKAMARMDGPSEWSGTPSVFFLMAILQRDHSLYRTIAQLASARLVEESMILARPLFEDSMRLQYVAEQPSDDRERWMDSYVHQCYADLHNTYKFRMNDIMGSDMSDRLARKIFGDMQNIARHGNARMQNLPGDGELISLVNRQSERVSYELSHQFTHGRALPMIHRLELIDGEMAVGMRDEYRDAVLPVLAGWSTSSILHAYRAMASMVGWDEPTEVTDAFAQLPKWGIHA